MDLPSAGIVFSKTDRQLTFQLAKIVRASRAMANRNGFPYTRVGPMRSWTSGSSPSSARRTTGPWRILKPRWASDLPPLRFVSLFVILGRPLRESVKGQLRLTRNLKIGEKE